MRRFELPLFHRLRNALAAAVGAAIVYLVLAVVLPVPGGDSFRALAGRLVPGLPPGPGQWFADVDQLERKLLPVVEELELSYYLLTPGPCRILEYRRGDYRDGNPKCKDLVPFDAEARAAFDKVTYAVALTGVRVERIFRNRGGIYVQLEDYSYQYNWQYVYLPDVGLPPEMRWPGEEWTHIRGGWWFHRDHDD